MTAVPAAARPSTTYPMWLTLVYAISRFRFVCASATSEPYTMAMTARMPIGRANCAQVSGIIDIRIRTNPYVPIFRSTPARIADAGPGASTCAGGSHVWTGTSGVLIANPMKKPAKTIVAYSVPDASGCWRMISAMSKVRGSVTRYSPRIARSSGSDPAKV